MPIAASCCPTLPTVNTGQGDLTWDDAETTAAFEKLVVAAQYEMVMLVPDAGVRLSK